MAKNQSPALFMVALLVFAAATPPAHALLTGVLNALTVVGSFCCAKYGHCPDGPPLPGIPVSLVCTGIGGANVTVAEGLTGVNGAFLLTVTNLNLKQTLLGAITGVIGGKLPCTVDVKLPLSQLICQDLSSTVGFACAVPTVINMAFSPINGVIGCAAVSMDSVSV